MPSQRDTNFDPKAMEALAKQMIQDGTMPTEEQMEAMLEEVRKEHAAKILEARERDQRESLETPPPETTGKPTRQAGDTDLGLAKPDDPVYKRGWTITLGGLRGQSKKPLSSTPAETPESQPDN